ncbi:peptide-methionine (S)-S-oxide reductase [Cellulophaga sp. HaHaR_3_176]|uniref:peptide-methionine (S)-S-oxide reductase n=1 Tax=Cellulophaga sp. HaHaR_3_176 TaxID=1942464 RepID=UPI001C1FDC97|nr:peptide-methionine (S)-S-oxide reductase [Cellulophaga sp. HaHaR_3_176]QWX82679.1 peptide-methionine (S)-S-oxide reductase [Cellulophaga sp. HaHaR_3_176]
MSLIKKIAFGGGCHWCTEAVFQSLLGVTLVEQGFIAGEDEHSAFSEAVIIHYNTEVIPLHILIEIHLYTHKSTKNHTMRTKYRSAVYVFDDSEKIKITSILLYLQKNFKEQIITKVHTFKGFKPSEVMFHNYYFSNPEKPFCDTYIAPKLKLVLDKFSKYVNKEKVVNNDL